VGEEGGGVGEGVRGAKRRGYGGREVGENLKGRDRVYGRKDHIDMLGEDAPHELTVRQKTQQRNDNLLQHAVSLLVLGGRSV
jgi:hypothetical protein